jgi:hypothetical protein
MLVNPRICQVTILGASAFRAWNDGSADRTNMDALTIALLRYI